MLPDSKISKSKVKEILVHDGKGVNGFKMIIVLDNDKVIYFNSLWMHYFDVKDFKKKYSFKKIEIEVDYIERIYCFEGVGFYIIFSNDYIVNIYEEIYDIRKPDYKYALEIVSNKDKDAYKAEIKDILELGEPDDIIEVPPEFW
ncbi:MAG: hypothetical protein GKR88_01885 [Flavobacteriaceae bacterium]|nr:MAG: hypothetical protein GKR88_01885 [Flavobacteriaceae bacterium]